MISTQAILIQQETQHQREINIPDIFFFSFREKQSKTKARLV